MKNRSRLVLMLVALLLINVVAPSVRATREPEAEALMPRHNHHGAEQAFSCTSFVTAPTTWGPVEVECPVCKTKNIFLRWMSYGNYIYQWPSKYQLIFWPETESAAWYSCRKCRLSIHMSEFEGVPQDKIEALRVMLKEVSLPPQKELSLEASMEKPPYLEIPVSARLLAAEKVYRTLGQKDEFWSTFYRILGYHLDAEKKETEAAAARRKALSFTEKLLADKANEGRRKELLYISGAMKHFLRDDTGALKDFEEAARLTYAIKENKEEDNEGYNGYLSKLIAEYTEMLRKGEGPRSKSAVTGR